MPKTGALLNSRADEFALLADLVETLAKNRGPETTEAYWHSLRAHRNATCLFGMTPTVAEVLAGLSLTDIDRIVDRRFRHFTAPLGGPTRSLATTSEGSTEPRHPTHARGKSSRSAATRRRTPLAGAVEMLRRGAFVGIRQDLDPIMGGCDFHRIRSNYAITEILNHTE